MIEVGKYNMMRAIRSTTFGMLLAKDDDKELVLLPEKHVPAKLNVGDELEVFLYKDKEDAVVATTQKPKILLNQFACLEVLDSNDYGVFMDWGLDKDLFVHRSEKIRSMHEGEFHFVFLYLDGATGKLAATADIDRILETEPTVNEGEEVEVLIGHSSDLGVNVLVNDKHRGLIYHNEIFKPLHPNDRLKAFVKSVRPDGKIDVSLQQQGFKNIDPSAEYILEKLKAHDGYLPLTDNSDPFDVKRYLEMSKKTFKKAIGSLYKQRLILIKEDGIYLVE